MKFSKAVVSLFFLFLLIFSSFAFAEDQASPAQAYLDELHAQGKERVIVSFKDDAEVDASLVDKYGGKLIRVFTIIKALVCEIPQENIELLKQEEAVKYVAPDPLIAPQPGGEERDPEELAEFLRLKEEYLTNIKEARQAAIRQATKDYVAALKGIIAEKKQIQDLYNKTLRKFAKADKKNRPLYRAQLMQYRAMLKECNNKMKEALQEYRQEISETKGAYVTALNSLEEKVNEMMLLSYTGTVEVRWNNLEAGLNSHAAWDRYNLDGTGIKIAFLDTGINYLMPNLGGGIGPGFKCLGGYDFVDDDSDSINPLGDSPEETEIHGTEVASLGVGQGVDGGKVIGVAYNASYYAVRVMRQDIGFGSDAIAGIEWASTEPHKADIISMSFGSYDPENNPEVIMMREACNAAYNAGIILVAGSGNSGYTYSAWPAGFENVISVGAHAEDQTLYNNVGSSNGGVDIVAPGARVYTVHPDNSAWWVWGTSFATPHASALIALQLQYVKQNNTQPNNGYLWELTKHSAKDMPLIPDPVYLGSGKAWAAETLGADPWVDGSIDAMAEKWPLSYDIAYDNYLYLEEGLYPAYYIGTNMYYDVNLTNNTDTAGNHLGDIENLEVTATQAYYQHEGEANLPGSPICAFSTVSSLTAGSLEILPDTYYLPWAMVPGLNRTALDLEFEFADDTSNRLIKVSYPYAGLWCPPPAINEGFPQ
ncbi:MAG: Serine protease, subtilase family [Parcubacteria group bacterium GW2011_GWA2_46_7]|nr:MAG: Serine protease, subtilase family [Parcubacteria group bacterium GW2011_GWA2_46_7]